MKEKEKQKLLTEDQVECLVATKFAWMPLVPSKANIKAMKEFREVLKEVLVQVWQVISEEVEKIESIKLVFASFACPIDYLNIHKPTIDLWQLIFHGSLIEPLSNGSPEWREYVKYQITHQLCLFHLKKNAFLDEDVEILANNLARLWGFMTIEPTDPKAPVTVWDMIVECKFPEENLDETLQRLIEEGLITKFRQPEKSRTEK